MHASTIHAPRATGAPLAAQPRTAQVKAFERIERGKIDRLIADPAFIREVEQAVTQILAVLYTPLDGGRMLVLRDAWTRSPLMRLLASVTLLVVCRRVDWARGRGTPPLRRE